jgi:hypothetical protein
MAHHSQKESHQLAESNKLDFHLALPPTCKAKQSKGNACSRQARSPEEHNMLSFYRSLQEWPNQHLHPIAHT